VRAALAPYAVPIRIAALLLAAFTLTRLVLYVAYRSDFASLPAGGVLWAFLRGLRFDASVVCMVAGLPLVLLTLPFSWAQRPAWRGTWTWVAYAATLLFIGVLAADGVYYGHVHRHVGPEIAFLGEAIEDVGTGARQRPLAVLGFLAAAGGLFWAWRKFMRSAPMPETGRRGRIAVACAALLLLVGAAHGNPFGKRLRPVDAFADVPPSAGHLALNGPYAVVQSLTSKRRAAKSSFYPESEALASVREELWAARDEAVDERYPLLRRRPGGAGARPNVVLLMLESWDAWHTDAMRRERGLEPLGCTPNFDALCREGVLYTRFHANGLKSMDGMIALMCGFPPLPGLPYLGQGTEQSGLPFLGRLALKEGYATYFLQGTKRKSFRTDAIAALAGFEQYRGAEDIVVPEKPTGDGAVPGEVPPDHDLLREAHRMFSASKRPFLGFVFTASTHAPYAWPSERWRKHEPTSAPKRFLNALGYCDWAVGQFFAAAKAAGYFENTVFILAGDHVSGMAGLVPDDPQTYHQVPCLVIAPGLKPGVDGRLGSQLDVIPTIADLAGWRVAHGCLGRSLAEAGAPERGIMCAFNDLVLRVEKDGWLLHDLRRRVSGRGDGAEAERKLLSFVQVASTLQREGRVHRDE